MTVEQHESWNLLEYGNVDLPTKKCPFLFSRESFSPCWGFLILGAAEKSLDSNLFWIEKKLRWPANLKLTPVATRIGQTFRCPTEDRGFESR